MKIRFVRTAQLLATLLLLSGLAACQRAAPRKVEIVHAPPSVDVARWVKGEMGRAAREGREVLVYVGATWCEPCQRFHAAAAAGRLDASYPTLRLLEFDRDRDEERLRAAGYTSNYIPLFAVPGPDGRASGRQVEGSIKGEGAVDNIAPRLSELLGKRS